jgi:hypothetical protein
MKECEDAGLRNKLCKEIEIVKYKLERLEDRRKEIEKEIESKETVLAILSLEGRGSPHSESIRRE